MGYSESLVSVDFENGVLSYLKLALLRSSVKEESAISSNFGQVVIDFSLSNVFTEAAESVVPSPSSSPIP